MSRNSEAYHRMVPEKKSSQYSSIILSPDPGHTGYVVVLQKGSKANMNVRVMDSNNIARKEKGFQRIN